MIYKRYFFHEFYTIALVWRNGVSIVGTPVRYLGALYF